MPIVPSRSKRIHELIAALSAPRAAERESAIARLTLLGERAVGALAEALRNQPSGRAGAAETLSRLSAAGNLAATEALRLALSDPAAAVRRASRDALAEPTETRGPLPTRLPEGPEAIPMLHAALARLSARGRDDLRAAEAAVRIHEILAARGSRIALYDLRERLETRPARDAERLLKAACLVADASFVPTLVRLAADVLPLVPACAAALRSLVRREGLRKSHRSIKAIRPEHRAVFESLWARAKRQG